MQVILFLLKKKFKFLHKKTRNNLIFSFFEAVESVKRDFFSHFANDVRVDTLHVDLDAGDFFDVLADEVETLADEAVDFEEFSWNKNSHSIFYIKFRPSILHDGRISKGLAFLILLRLSTFLNFQLPIVLLHSLLFRLFLFVLLHREDVV